MPALSFYLREAAKLHFFQLVETHLNISHEKIYLLRLVYKCLV